MWTHIQGVHTAYTGKMDTGKRFKWTVGTISQLLNELMDKHQQSRVEKRNGKIKEFYADSSCYTEF
jgi:hypothetical protein